MTVISISVTESVEQVVSGIPRFLYVTANNLATIFYTLDGSTPTLYSSIYTGPIELPTSKFVVVFSAFATDGTDTSAIVADTYQTVETGKNVRFSHSGTDAPANSTQGLQDKYPFGSTAIVPGQIFLGPESAGLNVYDPLLPATSNGFDGQGNPGDFTNEALIGIPTKTQPIILSETNAQGERGPGIGTLPRSTVQQPVPPPEQVEYNSTKLFDPRALVIFQDFTKPNDPGKPVVVNREYFSLENIETSRDGNQYYNTALENATSTGSFVRQHYNPANQTLTYYYRDRVTDRWIISTTPYTPSATSGRYYSMVFSKHKGAGFVFLWRPFKANYLF